MDESALRGWENFYVIVGSSGAALTGLQFVVIAIGADVMQASGESVSAFGTPTVVHFCAALLVSSILSAPWASLPALAIALALCGGLGVLYITTVAVRARRQKDYQPVLSDWVWHTWLPFVDYAAIFGAGLELPHHPRAALFTTAAALLMLLFIGIHNAWDTVVWFATVARKRKNQK